MIEEIINNVTRGRGYRMRYEEIKMLCYADNTLLIAQSENDLQRLLPRFSTAAMVISTQKT